MRSCNTIILDFGGVLMRHDREGCLEAFRQLMAQEDITNVLGLGNNLPDTLRARFELGELTAEEFVCRVQALCKPGTTAQQVINAWNKIHAGITDSTWAEIRRLKDKGYRLYLFSNTDAIHWQHTIELYKEQIYRCFDRVFLSFEMGLCKPDGRVYEYVANETGANKSSTYFVDDTEINRRMAEDQVGWITCANLADLEQKL